MFNATRRLATAKHSDGIWSEILEQAARTAEFPNSHLLLLGRKDVGKSSVLWALQKIGFGQLKPTEVESYKDNDGVSALDYAYINVRNIEDDDTSESLAQMNVWILQNLKHRDILQHHLKAEYLKHAAVLICLDLSEPWSLRDELIAWLDFVADLLPSMLKELNIDEQEMMRYKVSHYVATYKANSTRETAEDFAKRQVDSSNVEEGEHIVKINFGVPIIVCVCKSDYTSTLDTRNTQGQIDVVEAHLRQLCLPYGASLIFFSAKEDLMHAKNRILLYRYLMHRVHGFEISESAVDEPKETIFWPAGWDTEDLINQFAKTTIAEGLHKPFGTIINKRTSPSLKQVPYLGNDSDRAIKVEDMNNFLASQLAQMPSLGIGLSSNQISARESPTPQHARDRDRDSKISARQARSGSEAVETSRGPQSSRKPDTARGDPASLRTFFHTLLAKGQKPPTSPRASMSPSGNMSASMEDGMDMRRHSRRSVDVSSNASIGEDKRASAELSQSISPPQAK